MKKILLPLIFVCSGAYSHSNCVTVDQFNIFIQTQNKINKSQMTVNNAQNNWNQSALKAVQSNLKAIQETGKLANILAGRAVSSKRK